MYKIKIKDPKRENEILYFTCKEYEISEKIIKFQDRTGLKQIWHIDSLINIEELNGSDY